jgi:hypothetical protein
MSTKTSATLRASGWFGNAEGAAAVVLLSACRPGQAKPPGPIDFSADPVTVLQMAPAPGASLGLNSEGNIRAKVGSPPNAAIARASDNP